MTNLLNLSSSSSSHLYLSAFYSVLENGEELAPRGKKIREMRPGVVEFLDARDRITQLEDRKINTFFHAAEVIWMMLGRSDVEFLTKFNKNMATFSDDGVYFNAPYGERVRSWGKHDASGEIVNPIDQLYSVYRILESDIDTRQAIAVIGNPRFDNADYLLNGGKDVSCNREMYFKVRDNKLDITVTNRSNDVHWGLFTANLPVFTTFQELVASWFGLELGTYTQFTDSMHVYLEDYGAKLNTSLKDAYSPSDSVFKYTFNEPKIKPRSYAESNEMLLKMEDVIERIVLDDEMIRQIIEIGDTQLDSVISEIKVVIDDPYFEMLVLLMLTYRVHINNKELKSTDENESDQRLDTVLLILEAIPASVWKRSALTFLSTSKRYSDTSVFNKLRDELDKVAMVTSDTIDIVGGR